MSIPAASNGPQLHNVRLNQNFGDSPVGRLGNNGVQSAPAGAARTGGSAHAAPPSPGLSLGARILNAVTPQGLRAESKVLGGLQATSAFFDGRPSTYRIVDPRQFVPSPAFAL